MLEYYSAMKKKDILPFTTTWTNLEGIMLSEVSQKKDKVHDLTYTWNLNTHSHTHIYTLLHSSQIQRTDS